MGEMADLYGEAECGFEDWSDEDDEEETMKNDDVQVVEKEKQNHGGLTAAQLLRAEELRIRAESLKQAEEARALRAKEAEQRRLNKEKEKREREEQSAKWAQQRDSMIGEREAKALANEIRSHYREVWQETMSAVKYEPPERRKAACGDLSLVEYANHTARQQCELLFGYEEVERLLPSRKALPPAPASAISEIDKKREELRLKRIRELEES